MRSASRYRVKLRLPNLEQTLNQLLRISYDSVKMTDTKKGTAIADRALTLEPDCLVSGCLALWLALVRALIRDAFKLHQIENGLHGGLTQRVVK